ncbi:MAG: hypothetical protein RLZZ540_1272 [Bacteroidota bacterium]|jgi:hypothetical protein
MLINCWHYQSLELFPAIRCNLFIFKEKIKRISTAIGAKKQKTNFTIQTKLNEKHCHHHGRLFQ